MPARDSCHDQVSHALQKDGWTVNPMQPRFKSDVYAIIDIEAKRTDQESVYIEVKCFPGTNDTQELYIALGQYLVYREILAKAKPNSTLYLAVPERAYEIVFTSTIQAVIARNHVKIMIVDTEMELIVRWIES